MTANLFDYLGNLRARDDGPASRAARAPRRPRTDYDLKLFPRSPDWWRDTDSLDALRRIECEPSWVNAFVHARDGYGCACHEQEPDTERWLSEEIVNETLAEAARGASWARRDAPIPGLMGRPGEVLLRAQARAVSRRHRPAARPRSQRASPYEVCLTDQIHTDAGPEPLGLYGTLRRRNPRRSPPTGSSARYQLVTRFDQPRAVTVSDGFWVLFWLWFWVCGIR